MKALSNNGLSPTMVLRFINSQLGSTVQTIELSEQEIMRVVFQQSLHTFSQYFPFLPIVTLSKDDRINGNHMEYRIPNAWNLQILSLHKYYLTSESRFGTGWIAPIISNPIDAQLLSDRYSMFVTPLIIDYYPPNRLAIKQNYYNASGYLTVQFKAVHPEHLKTIEPNLRDDFLQLAFYDVCISLYPLRHRFTTINTIYGSLEPFTELLDSAEDKRKELLEKWNRLYLQSGSQKKIWVM
jgi:hypothetical protein